MKDKLFLTLLDDTYDHIDTLSQISEEDEEYISQGKSHVATLVSLMLAKVAIRQSGCNNSIIRRNDAGKPIVLSPQDPRYISISQSCGLIACLISSRGQIGMDIEYMMDYNDDLAKILMTDQEYAHINRDSNNANVIFSKYWTMKEAYYKISGIDDLETSIMMDFSVATDLFTADETQYFVYSAQLNKWWLSILADHEVSSVDIQIYNINDLYQIYRDNIS